MNTESDGTVEAIILYGRSYKEVNDVVKEIGGSLYDLGYGYGIVTMSPDDLIKLAQNPYVQYIELPKSLYYSDANSNRAACVQRAQTTFDLKGKGVIVGFIDTGIDFTHPAFRNDDGTTRIEYIYDLSSGGTEYNKDKINEALKSEDPYSVVPVYDLTEHGTHVAGIACAGGKINPQYYGVAPESSIIMVKSGRGLFSLSTQIMKGLKFLIDKAKELSMPLVVNISLSTNDGAHDGTSLLEQYINTVAISEKVTIVIAAGNEGDAAHHVGGRLDGQITIKFNVAEDETAVVMNLYKSVLPSITLELITPTGVSTGEITIEEGFTEGVISQNRYSILSTGPKPFDIVGEIAISLITGSSYILSGEWTIIIRVTNKYNGTYDIWLPISEGLNTRTKFLQPTLNNTLGIPATVSNVISVGSYNYISRNISPFSGRGKMAAYYTQKPEMVAPGEGISAPIPNESYDTKSGTSMASPHVAGICALLLQWGIVNGNDSYLYGNRIKYYLIMGARKERTDIDYPDTSWGYGEVCAYDSMQELIRVLNIVSRGGKDRMPEPIIDKYADDTSIVGILVEYINRNDVIQLNNKPNTSVIIISDSYAIIYLPVNEIPQIYGSIKRLVITGNPPIYTLNDITPVEASNAINYHNNPYLNLTGKGVLVGILDTGIDYLNTEFQKEDDTTRILRIWDQTIESEQEIYGLKLGTEYTEEQINEAIRLQKSGGNPYSVVPSRDTVGHGTMVAGLAAARGKNPDVLGAAPQCSLAIVKLREVNQVILEDAGIDKDNSQKYSNVGILCAIRYISLLATDLKMPLVLLIGLGSNIGAHNGRGIVDTYIEGISGQAGVIVVTGTGNEGDTDTHTEGIISKNGEEQTIEIEVGEKQKSLNFQIWVSKPDTMSLSVISPSGESIGYLDPRIENEHDVKFVYEGTTMNIAYQIPDNIDGDEKIDIKARGLRQGIWKFKLRGDYIVSGKYWAWLPQRFLLEEGTKFLHPSQYTTLTLPSDTSRALSVAYYNQNNNATVSSSGRGYTRDGRKKPDIAAGGINARVIKLNNGVGVASGSSVATAVAAGVCAMILEWAVVQKNKEDIYPKQLISYIIRGAKTRPGDSYPNEEWGYGSLDVTEIFNSIRDVRSSDFRSESSNEDLKYDEFYIGGLFIRKPL